MPTELPHETLAVVLDFDGTLVKSMQLHAEAYRRALAPFGVRILDEEIYAREGARSETIIADFLATVGRTEPGLAKQVSEQKQQLFRSFPPPSLYPGAADMVKKIRQAAPKLGLVTGTRRENLHRLIPELVPLFDVLLAQDAYTHDKPHPEPYLKTAAALGLPPARCAAVENAIRGVKSARAAGYGYVAAIATTVPAKDLMEAGADAVFDDHAAVADAITDWLRRAGRPGNG